MWLVYFVAFISSCKAQQQTLTFPVSENQSVIPDSITNLNNIPSSLASILPTSIAPNIPGNAKRNDWWPPSEQEMMQTSPYPTEIHQSIPSSYYLSASSPSAVLSNYRADYPGPYGYPEYVYPVSPPNAHTQVQSVVSKYMAIGLFIGLLTLFAIIQGSMMTAKRKDVIGDVIPSRRKRDLLELTDINDMTPEQQDIFNNDSKVRCIQRTICQENQLLLRDFGVRGKKFAKYLTQSVKKSLENLSGWDRLVEDAGAAGLRGEDCSVLYRDCVLPVISKFHE